MNIEIIRGVLGWCTAINYGLLIIWFLVFALGHDWIRRLHGRWFRMPVEQFDAMHYAAMGNYKIGILLLNLVPYIALLIVA